MAAGELEERLEEATGFAVVLLPQAGVVPTVRHRPRDFALRPTVAIACSAPVSAYHPGIRRRDPIARTFPGLTFEGDVLDDHPS